MKHFDDTFGTFFAILDCSHVAFDARLLLQVIVAKSVVLSLGFALLLNLRMRLGKTWPHSLVVLNSCEY